jgi:undecaprenyl diphosphate synthase
MDTHIPTCVGIILDGNRRWAKTRGMSTLEGHRKGAETLRDTARFMHKKGIAHLAVFAFSTENWNRSAEEVTYLMKLFSETIEEHFSKLTKENIRIRFVGQRERFAPDLQEAMTTVEAQTAGNSGLTLWCCLSYGGRAEIVAAARSAAAEGEITEESLATHLWTAGMPDPDIIIRPGGEKRLSGFLTWQSVYSELFFIDAFWPDFNEKEFDAILAEFAGRERRHGK